MKKSISLLSDKKQDSDRHSFLEPRSRHTSFLPDLPINSYVEEQDKNDAAKFMKFSPGQTTCELISPDRKGKMRIKHVSVPITTNSLRFQEL